MLGDRATDLDRLPGGAWDTVIDTCGFDPATVGGAARTLADRAAHYAFVSSASVYRDWPVEPVDEDSAVFEGGEQEYGPLKAAAERAAEAAMPGRVLHVRAGVIVGPHENIGRLPYWLRRMARGGDVLAPEPRGATVQLIDARDLARWVLAMAADCRAGVFNAVAPPGLLIWEELLELCRAVVNPHARLCWVDGDRVAAALADPWTELPLWPAPVADAPAVYSVAADRAREARADDPAAGGDRRRDVGLAARLRGTCERTRPGAREHAPRGAREGFLKRREPRWSRGSRRMDGG